MHVGSEALRISPKYSSTDWDALSADMQGDWPRAAEIVRDRLEGRFLRFVDSWLSDPFSGFVVLSIDCLLAETIQQFRQGQIDGTGHSETNIKMFLAAVRFQPWFNSDARKHFYVDIRCGLLHQAEAKGKWLVRRGQVAMLQKVADGSGYIIDVPRFHAAIRESLDDYLRELEDASNHELRANLWTKMDHISRVRTARGLLYPDEETNVSQAST